jgi:hypothetical protein
MLTFAASSARLGLRHSLFARALRWEAARAVSDGIITMVAQNDATSALKFTRP